MIFPDQSFRISCLFWLEIWIERQEVCEELLIPARTVAGVVTVVKEELLPLADVPDGEDTGDGAVAGMGEEPLRAVVVEAMVHLVSLHQE